MFDNKSYNIANNQMIIEEDTYLTFYSYNTCIAKFNKKDNKLYLNSEMWDYSKTTRRYFKLFIEEYTNLAYKNKKEFLKLISDTENIITILN